MLGQFSAVDNFHPWLFVQKHVCHNARGTDMRFAQPGGTIPLPAVHQLGYRRVLMEELWAVEKSSLILVLPIGWIYHRLVASNWVTYTRRIRVPVLSTSYVATFPRPGLQNLFLRRETDEHRA